MVFNYFDSRLGMGIGIVCIFLYSNQGYQFVKNVGFKICWKLLEWTVIVDDFYKKKLRAKFHELTDNYFRKDIKVIRDGEEILSFKNVDEAALVLNHSNEINYDLILQTKFHKTDSKKNFTLLTDKIVVDNYKENIIASDVGFIIFQLKFTNHAGTHKYDINLKEPKNYLIKDNILKSNFFKYYIKNIYDVDIPDDFSIEYMTNDMTTSSLNNPFFIKFNEVGFTSFPIKKERKEEEEEVLEDCDNRNNLIDDIINQEKLKEHKD
jgi:hypothetical protein